MVGLQEIILKANTKLGGVPVSTTQSGKLLSCGQRVEYSREFLPQ